MMKFLKDLTKEYLEGKKVFLRVDFNVAREGKQGEKIIEDFKIRSHKTTIDYLLSSGAQVACVSHTSEDGLGYGPIAAQIGDILGRPILFVSSVVGSELIEGFKTNPLVLAENVRLHPGEKENDAGHAEKLAGGFDLYVNDAFAVSHRPETSLVAITKQLPSYAGFIVEQEVTELAKALTAPLQGKVVVLGGAKISTKMPIINNFLKKAEYILLGGALINQHQELMMLKEDKILLPKDTIPAQGNAFDIGPQAVQQYVEVIRNAQFVVWNGPMGKYEEAQYANGTRAVAEAIAEVPFSIIGGGDTVAAVDQFALRDKFSYVSTGGGAMLDFLAGKELPALKALGYYE